MHKVKGKDNPADLFTKHLSSEAMCKCFRFMNVTFMQGRPQAAPELNEDEKLEVDDNIETEETRDEVLESWKRGLDHYEE